jgi:HAD superfamily hydrolase (TIGR01509 family)
MMRSVTGDDALVIFDCDGVLVDSEPIAVGIDLVILAEVGIEMSEAEVIRRFVGRSPGVLQETIAERLGRPLSPERIKHYEQLYQAAYEAELAPIDGIVDALDALDRIGRRICVASSSRPESLRRKLTIAGLHDRFAPWIFSASQVRRGKPAPDLFLYAADRMGVDPGRCVVVEDSRPGVEAARAAGMPVCAYAGGVTAAAELDGPGTTLLTDMRELPGLIDQLI